FFEAPAYHISVQVVKPFHKIFCRPTGSAVSSQKFLFHFPLQLTPICSLRLNKKNKQQERKGAIYEIESSYDKWS
ncbi:hypothetical protein, partial [Clostridium sp.]|uniref:hypothetical protein n=1 Tax=Clostridium sp. TaxID=1506 RepID=UPI003996AFE5